MNIHVYALINKELSFDHENWLILTFRMPFFNFNWLITITLIDHKSFRRYNDYTFIHCLQHEDSCKQILQKIVSSVTDQIPTCLPSLDKLVQRSRYDRLSVLAATTIILAHAHFDIPSDQVLHGSTISCSYFIQSSINNALILPNSSYTPFKQSINLQYVQFKMQCQKFQSFTMLSDFSFQCKTFYIK